jgi:uncharacterized protein with PQ loop repeat
MKAWATVLGVTAAILAAIQYMPQLVKTYKAGVVGALSIPMMCVQTPGGVIMVISIALRYVIACSLSLFTRIDDDHLPEKGPIGPVS